jgi:hypothetical protein
MKATCIWQPRYWDRKVLVSIREVRPGKNFLFFCSDRNWNDLYSYDGSKVKEKCEVGTNGKIAVYEIPLDWLENEGDLPEQFVEVRKQEYAKYRKKMLKKK